MVNYPADTVAQLLARHDGEAPAIGSPGKPWLSHAGLNALASSTVRALNEMGVGRNDRVAIVTPNGPLAATTFLCIAAGCTTAPLNAAYKQQEFAFYLEDLRAKALVLPQGFESPARSAAAALGIPVVEVVPGATAAGAFTLAGPEAPIGTAERGGFAEADDIALVLHTSGTTARPKVVPLSHRNITASAFHIGHGLALQASDVGLNVMPLFHIHGLIAGVLSAVAAGGAVSCATGFVPFQFFNWAAEVRPTWYSAVPTMHQTLLDLAPRFAKIIAEAQFRFIRSSSASLPPQVMTALETTFGVPVIESYGMTEAAHQMASSPLPPRARFAGSVGVAAGPDIAIMDDEGTALPAGSIGEVVIRGRNVTAGYENNPDANAKSFTAGWFRTGDQGMLDAEGYLRLTGRLKEIINRAGEKVSPLEVDTVLMDHPAVAQVVTFAMPHRIFGEEVAAAAVLHKDVAVTEAELIAFAGERLAAFKVPRRIIMLAEIPKGATGKLQRIGLAEKLGLSG